MATRLSSQAVNEALRQTIKSCERRLVLIFSEREDELLQEIKQHKQQIHLLAADNKRLSDLCSRQDTTPNMSKSCSRSVTPPKRRPTDDDPHFGELHDDHIFQNPFRGIIQDKADDNDGSEPVTPQRSGQVTPVATPPHPGTPTKKFVEGMQSQVSRGRVRPSNESKNGITHPNNQGPQGFAPKPVAPLGGFNDNDVDTPRMPVAEYRGTSVEPAPQKVCRTTSPNLGMQARGKDEKQQRKGPHPRDGTTTPPKSGYVTPPKVVAQKTVQEPPQPARNGRSLPPEDTFLINQQKTDGKWLPQWMQWGANRQTTDAV